MRLRIESSVVHWLVVAVAPALALAAGGCGDDFESCTTTRTCSSGKAGSGGSAGAAGSAAGSHGGATSGTGGGGNGTGGSRGGESGTPGDAGDAGDVGDSGGSSGRAGAGGSGGSDMGESGSGGEGGDSLTPPDPCESVTCEHGTCENVEGAGVCECESGFTGTACELPTFEWIELLPGHDLVVNNILLSENATVVGQNCQSDNCSATEQGFRWTHQKGTSAFGGSDNAGFTDVNQDASVTVGFWRETSNTYSAFRWTEASGFVNLGILPGGDASQTSGARGVNADGSVVVGLSGSEPFRWTLGSGMVKLALPSGRPSSSYGDAFAVSDDGSIVAGNLMSSLTNVLRWTAEDEVEWIEPSRYAFATDMSADGEVIVGNADFGGVLEAFRWTRVGGMVSLGRPTECPGTEAGAVSGDGRIVVVSCESVEGGYLGYLWDVASGFRRVENVLQGIGADASDAGAVGVYRLSFDGSTILGFVLPTGTSKLRPWIARLPPARN